LSLPHPLSPASEDIEMSDPIEEYFAQYPNFNFLPSTHDWRQVGAFNSLAQELGWSQKHRQNEWKKFKNLWTRVAETEFSESTLEHYQTLCEDLDISPIPESVTACKNELRKVYVNIVDLVQYRKDKRHRRRARKVTKFDTLDELSDYSTSTWKWYPRETAKAEMLRELLKVLA
jgi:hypothetical protein